MCLEKYMKKDNELKGGYPVIQLEQRNTVKVDLGISNIQGFYKVWKRWR